MTPVPSERMSYVLTELARGATYTEIAQGLGVHPRSLQAWLTRQFTALRLPDRAALITYAYVHEWLPVDDTALEPPLTRVMQRTLACSALGLTSQLTSRRLHVSLYSARTYEERLRAQLGARSRPHAVARGFQLGHLPAALRVPVPAPHVGSWYPTLRASQRPTSTPTTHGETHV